MSYVDHVTTSRSATGPTCHRVPRTSPGYSEETEAEVVWTCLLVNRHGKDHLVRHCEGSKQKGRERQRPKEAVERQRPPESAGTGTGLCRVTEGRGRQTQMEEAGCEINGGAPTTLWVKGQIDR